MKMQNMSEAEDKSFFLNESKSKDEEDNIKERTTKITEAMTTSIDNYDPTDDGNDLNIETLWIYWSN